MTARILARLLEPRRCAALLALGATLLGPGRAYADPFWPSGISCFYGGRLATLESWRGSRFTALHGWANQDTWRNMLIFFGGPTANNFAANRNGRVVAISTPLLTAEVRGQFSACASGAFDWVWREVATKMTRHGLADAIIRLGWEANGNWFPWSINGNYAGYKACFRRAVQVMRSVQPRLRIEWPMNREVYSRKLNTLVNNAYPGNDVVDIIGLSYYDHWPAATSETVWNSSFKPELDFWVSFARRNGKKLGFGEWGLGFRRGGGFDNPLYVRKMYEFWNNNRDLIAYESYFNCGQADHIINPESHNPNASSTYRNLW